MCVYLIASSGYRNKTDPSGVVDLGQLEGNREQQDNEIPPETDLTRYKTVMNWWKQSDTPFAATSLET